MSVLGDTQVAVLRSLAREHGSWHPGCGWVWKNRSTTIRILDSLVRRGLVTRTQRSYGPQYLITDTGHAEVRKRFRFV